MTYIWKGNFTRNPMGLFSGHLGSPRGHVTYIWKGNFTRNPMVTFSGHSGSPRGHQGSLNVKKSDFFKVGHVTFIWKGNFTRNPIGTFSGHTMSHRGLSRLRKVTSGVDWRGGPVSQDQTGPKGQYIRSRLARRASKSGTNWPDGPVHQN